MKTRIYTKSLFLNDLKNFFSRKNTFKIFVEKNSNILKTFHQIIQIEYIECSKLN